MKYTVDETRPRYMMILNNKTFPEPLQPRHGTEEDAKKLVDTFSKRRFTLTYVENLPAVVLVYFSVYQIQITFCHTTAIPFLFTDIGFLDQ